MREGLAPLLGNGSSSRTARNGRAARIIDPAFDGGRLRDSFPAVLAAARAASQRLTPGLQDIEPQAAHAAADVIFARCSRCPSNTILRLDVFEAPSATIRPLNLGEPGGRCCPARLAARPIRAAPASGHAAFAG